ncbi:MAG: hypothetical protein ACLVJO_11300 [[Clostridium] scindens]
MKKAGIRLYGRYCDGSFFGLSFGDRLAEIPLMVLMSFRFALAAAL